MATRKECDLCGIEISAIDDVYFVHIGKSSKIPFVGNQQKRAEICYSCCKKVELFITNMKGGRQ